MSMTSHRYISQAIGRDAGRAKERGGGVVADTAGSMWAYTPDTPLIYP